jgi:hypothetical protein
MHNAVIARPSRSRSKYEVDGAPAITMNCSAVICVGFRSCSNAPGGLITAKFTAAILKLSDLRHYHCLASHVFAKRDDFCFSA